MAMERLRAQYAQDTTLYGAEALEQSDGRFGTIPGIEVGKTWKSRKDCADDGVHVKTFAGISGNSMKGAYSIVLSGNYEDDIDHGETFIYTGTGGRAGGGAFAGETQQVKDQTFDHSDNKALQLSATYGRPVRVIRGPNPVSNFAPAEGYRYDGLHIVEKAYMAEGKSGWQVCRFEFRRLPNQPPLPEKWGWGYTI